MLGHERGPWRIFERLRCLVGIQHDAEGEPDHWGPGEWAQMLMCPACRSIWCALALVGAVLLWPPLLVVAYVLAASAAALLLGRIAK